MDWVTSMDDIRLPFQIESFALRGRMVRAGPLLDTIIDTHGYPDTVGCMLAEAVALAVLLAGALKYEGVFTLQTKGDGPIRLMVADVTSAGAVRAYAQFDEEALGRETRAIGPVPRLLGAGYLAFTVDQGGNTERYQGIVELEGATLAACVQHYFRQSEQVETGLVVAASHSPRHEGPASSRWRVGGIMLQRLPPGSSLPNDEDGNEPVFSFGYDMAVEAEDEGWRRALVLLGTCTPKELTDPDLSAQDLLFRLFHEEGVRIWPAMPIEAKCRCSRERIDNALRAIPREELREMEIGGNIEMTCEFCGKRYELGQRELDALHDVSPDSGNP